MNYRLLEAEKDLDEFDKLRKQLGRELKEIRQVSISYCKSIETDQCLIFI